MRTYLGKQYALLTKSTAERHCIDWFGAASVRPFYIATQIWLCVNVFFLFYLDDNYLSENLWSRRSSKIIKAAPPHVVSTSIRIALDAGIFLKFFYFRIISYRILVYRNARSLSTYYYHVVPFPRSWENWTGNCGSRKRYVKSVSILFFITLATDVTVIHLYVEKIPTFFFFSKHSILTTKLVNILKFNNDKWQNI